MNPLQVWAGEFGKAYTDRNRIDWRTRLPAFQRMLEGLQLKRVLEVGCNRGHNLVAVAELLKKKGEVVGIEPNRYALQLAKGASIKAIVLKGHAFDLPVKNGVFDLVFTAGLLIHIPLSELPTALGEVYRASKSYILAIEYFAENETVVNYRGMRDLLWKRDFLKAYKTQFPDLKEIRSGYWGPEDGFDRVHWWLLAKPAEAQEA